MSYMNNNFLAVVLGFVLGASKTLYEANLLSQFIYHFYQWFFGPMIVLPLIVIVLLEEPRWQDRVKIILSCIAGWVIGTNILIFA